MMGRAVAASNAARPATSSVNALPGAVAVMAAVAETIAVVITVLPGAGMITVTKPTLAHARAKKEERLEASTRRPMT